MSYQSTKDDELNVSKSWDVNTKDDHKRFNDKSFKEILLDIVRFFNVYAVLFFAGFSISAILYKNITVWEGFLLWFTGIFIASMVVKFYNNWKK